MSYNKKKKSIKVYIPFGMIIFLLICPLMAESASIRKNVQQGNVLYSKGDYGSSIKKYQEALEKDSESDIINFNLGTALYKKGDYAQSLEHLQKSLLSASDTLKQKVYYNLGNTLYQSGSQQKEKNLPGAISSLEKALPQYENALKLDHSDQDAQYNYEFVKKELEQLRQQLKEQKQSDGQSQKGQQQKKEDHQASEGQNDGKKPSGLEDKKEGEHAESQQNKQQESSLTKDEQQQEQQNKGMTAQQGDEGQNNEQSREDQEVSKQKKSTAQQFDAKELTKKEAQMLLDRYQQTEEPQGLLNVQPRVGQTEAVEKDW